MDKCAFLLLSLFVWTIQAQDPCNFPTTLTVSGGVVLAIATPQAVQNCFESIPFNSQYKTDTLAQLRLLVGLYSFADISANSGPPYNIQVDLEAELNAIEEAQYTSDWAFHLALNRVFARLGDAHTLYVQPNAYQQFLLFHPFGLSSSLDGTTQVVHVDRATGLAGIYNYDALTGFDVSPYVGRRVISIDDIPAVEWLATAGDRMGTSRDRGVRFNKAIIGHQVRGIYESEIPPTGTYTYLFEGITEPVEIPAVYVGTPFTSTAQFMQDIPFIPNQSRKKGPSFFKYFAEDPIRQIERFKEKVTGEPSIVPATKTLSNLSAMKRGGTDNGILESVSASNDFDWTCARYTLAGKEYLVLILTTFSPSNPSANLEVWLASAVSAMESCVAFGRDTSISELIVDVRRNGGGLICGAQIAHLELIPTWTFDTSNELYEPYDLRKTAVTEMSAKLEPVDLHLQSSVNPTQPFADSSWFSVGVSDTRGGKTSDYTQKWYFPNCEYFEDYVLPIGYSFEKIIILTDGLCGSACSLFATKLRYHGKAALISMGGLYGQPMDTSSFAGGNVEDWSQFVFEMEGGITGLDDLPTSAVTRFNYREMYIGNEVLPREFQRYPADVHFNNWNFDVGSLDAILATYASVVPSFSTIQFPVQPLGTYYGQDLNSAASIPVSILLSLSLILTLLL